jgi:hypothetical protein
MKKWGVALWQFIKKHKWSILLITLSLLVAGFFIWDTYNASTGADPVMGKLKPKVIKTVTAPIRGTQVDPAVAQNRPVAVVIENYPDARPQSGLNQADLVYETFAEGGITRFLAVFQTADYKEIGPVRSARPYFVEWAASYKAIFAHVGGSIDALNLIPKTAVLDMNQFYNANAFWRDNNRYAPHNVYTTVAKLYQAAQGKNQPTTDSSVPSFVFKKDIETKLRPVASAFTVNFNYDYAATWTYNPKDNYYYRSMLGVPQTDRLSKEQIKAKNVLIGYSEFSYGINSDGKQKVDIRTTGSGNAVIAVDGTRTSGTWRRPTSSSILRFYDANGLEVKLNPGTTWIDFVPTATQIK